MAATCIRQIEWAPLQATRPRAAGSNARLGPHGSRVALPLTRITDSEGHTGLGWSRLTAPTARELLGRPLAEAFALPAGTTEPWRVLDYPLWDLAGRRAGLPVHALLSGATQPAPADAACYDTSLYFDDLDLHEDAAAAERIALEAAQGWARGHRAFKVKVGRGARHLPLERGMRRDAAVVLAVRRAVGADALLLADANDGFNLNLSKRFLADTAEARLFWLEEPFREDPVLLGDLREWLRARGLPTLVADGEGLAAPGLMEWAARGLIDVVQYDILSPGFSAWLEIGRRCDAAGVRAAPHHYGGLYGNYASGHLGGAIRGFTFVEWDEARCPALDASAYTLRDGRVHLPALPGFGLGLDEAAFSTAVREQGFVVA